MELFEREVRKYKIFCKTEGCMNPSGGHRCNHRNVKDFSEKSRLAAVESFKSGVRINATSPVPTQPRWKRTSTGWLCPDCK